MAEEWEKVRDEGIFIYQIYYNDVTRARLDPHFIPLDNTANLRPDWYEFWVILNYLRNNPLQDGCLYGFLSPSFKNKTGYSGDVIIDLVRRHRQRSDVIYVNFNSDQTAYFVNQFEQGEYWHPGLMRASMEFFDGIGLDIRGIVSRTSNSAYSNFIIAKPNFWREWRQVAELFWEFCEQQKKSVGEAMVSYGRKGATAYAKAFVQERIASVITYQRQYASVTLDSARGFPITEDLFHPHASLEKNLRSLDLLKQYYVATRDPEFMSVFMKIRNRIKVLHPMAGPKA